MKAFVEVLFSSRTSRKDVKLALDIAESVLEISMLYTSPIRLVLLTLLERGRSALAGCGHDVFSTSEGLYEC